MDEKNCLLYQKQDEQKIQKRKLLQDRLIRLQKNGKDFEKKVNDKITSMQETRQILQKQGRDMQDVNQRFKKVIEVLNKNMINSLRNPLKQVEGKNFTSLANKSHEFRSEKADPTLVVQKMLKSRQVCILTGAGVSKSSGIPTFRGIGGVYSKGFKINGTILSPEQFLTMQTFEKYPAHIWQWVKQFRSLIHSKKPCQQYQLIRNLISKLIQKGVDVTLVTTNIDGFHSPIEANKGKTQFYQVHGNLDYVLCRKCSFKQKISDPQCQLPPPRYRCVKCGSKTCRPWVMFFDEKYDDKFDPAQIRDKKFPFIICIGTSLETGLSIKLASEAEQLVEINPECRVEVNNVHRFEQQACSALSKILDKF